ncbi:MAG TPA: GNAT family N-acetyltransferase [Pyrinomonadaceae bacterium]|nr:GNAT family N-acetyltransferase [Pyrinomonadaceae bacterium]
MIDNKLFTIREIDWVRDSEALLHFDASFTTDRIFRLETGDLSARFVEEILDEPLAKSYDLSGIEDAVNDSGLALVAACEQKITAFMTVKFEAWNRRAWLTHIYVASEFRGGGIGTRLVGEAIKFVKMQNARGLWLETQNFNYPAIRYYQNLGFRFCGFDRSLYDPAKVPGETAIYFCLDIGTGEAG